MYLEQYTSDFKAVRCVSKVLVNVQPFINMAYSCTGEAIHSMDVLVDLIIIETLVESSLSGKSFDVAFERLSCELEIAENYGLDEARDVLNPEIDYQPLYLDIGAYLRNIGVASFQGWANGGKTIVFGV